MFTGSPTGNGITGVFRVEESRGDETTRLPLASNVNDKNGDDGDDGDGGDDSLFLFTLRILNVVKVDGIAELSFIQIESANAPLSNLILLGIAMDVDVVAEFEVTIIGIVCFCCW